MNFLCPLHHRPKQWNDWHLEWIQWFIYFCFIELDIQIEFNHPREIINSRDIFLLHRTTTNVMFMHNEQLFKKLSFAFNYIVVSDYCKQRAPWKCDISLIYYSILMNNEWFDINSKVMQCDYPRNINSH